MLAVLLSALEVAAVNPKGRRALAGALDKRIGRNEIKKGCGSIGGYLTHNGERVR